MRINKETLLQVWREIIEENADEGDLGDTLGMIKDLQESIDGSTMSPEKGRTTVFPYLGYGEKYTYSQYGLKATKEIRQIVDEFEPDEHDVETIEEIYNIIKHDRKDLKYILNKLSAEDRKTFFFLRNIFKKLYKNRNEPNIHFHVNGTIVSYETLARVYINYFNTNIRPLI